MPPPAVGVEAATRGEEEEDTFNEVETNETSTGAEDEQERGLRAQGGGEGLANGGVKLEAAEQPVEGREMARIAEEESPRLTQEDAEAEIAAPEETPTELGVTGGEDWVKEKDIGGIAKHSTKNAQDAEHETTHSDETTERLEASPSKIETEPISPTGHLPTPSPAGETEKTDDTAQTAPEQQRGDSTAATADVHPKRVDRDATPPVAKSRGERLISACNLS
jgi:hypothetical protein